jgi:hypothetical protein
MSKKCSLQVLSDDGKILYGSPAMEALINKFGGWNNFAKIYHISIPMVTFQMVKFH